MRNSLRSAVVDSPISVVAIAVLLLWSLDSAVQVLGWLWFPATDYLATVIATLGSPYSSYSFRDQVSLSLTLWYAFEAIAAAVAAWLLSRWAFGLGRYEPWAATARDRCCGGIMIERLKRALKESYVGAIALGWLLAQDIMQFVNALATPLGEWANRREYPKLTQIAGGTAGSFQLALPGLVRFLLILVIWYMLVQWLYVRPSDTRPSYEPQVDA